MKEEDTETLCENEVEMENENQTKLMSFEDVLENVRDIKKKFSSKYTTQMKVRYFFNM